MSYRVRSTAAVWRSIYKAQLHIQVSFTYVKIGGHVSDNLSGGCKRPGGIYTVDTDFSACETRMDE